MMFGLETFYDLRKQEFAISYPPSTEEIKIKFSTTDFMSNNIPNGIVVFIGSNASGKSTAIYRLVQLLYADPVQRKLLTEKCRIKPNDVGFTRLIMVSYSCFDNFILPGITKNDYQRIVDDYEIRKRDSKFIFCGVRDVIKDYKEMIENFDEYVFLQNRMNHVNVKDTNSLAIEFNDAVDKCYNHDLWKTFLNNIKNEQPMLFYSIKELNEYRICLDFPTVDLIEFYNRQSTGNKFFLHAMAHIIANIEDNCMILFDEPENYLHPPLLSFMISQIRIILNKKRSVMLVSTHSPVVAQEAFANNVKIIKYSDGQIVAREPSIETYGENFGTIASEVFGLNTDVTRYYQAFDELFDHWNCRGKSADEVLTVFRNNMHHELSNQMMSYLIMKAKTEN
jgi:hypothetical protein